VLLVWMRGNAGGTDGGGRALEDLVLPRAQARERDDRRDALLHEIIPHGWSRMGLLAPDATITSIYAEHPALGELFRVGLWRFMDDPSALASLWAPSFRAVGIGWTLHRQGRAYLETRYYRESEAPLDSCWMLAAFIGDGGRSIAFVHLTRPRSARPYGGRCSASRPAPALARARVSLVPIPCRMGAGMANYSAREARWFGAVRWS
jgi:hypothetical protein